MLLGVVRLVVDACVRERQWWWRTRSRPSASRSLELPVTTKGGLVWKRGLWMSRWECYLHWYWNAFGLPQFFTLCSTRSRCSFAAAIYFYKQVDPLVYMLLSYSLAEVRRACVELKHRANVIGARPFLNDGKQDTVNVALANNVGKQSFM